MVEPVVVKEEVVRSSRGVKRKASNNVNPINSIKDGSIFVQSFDPEVLDCPICLEPFTIPVFQCENGHTACSSCCQHSGKICPSCALPIGSIRCRAIEKVVDSIKLSCENWKYGCNETLTYGKVFFEHVKTCVNAPCWCPIPGCDFSFSSRDLYYHCDIEHVGSVVTFQYDHTFNVSFANDDKFLVLGEKAGVLFLLNNRAETIGNVITVSCIGPSSSKVGHCYDLATKIEGISRTFRSFTKNISSKFDDHGSYSVGFLLDPVHCVGDNGKISLDICIWNRGSRPADVPRSTRAA